MKTYQIAVICVAAWSLLASDACADEARGPSGHVLGEAGARRAVEALIAELEGACPPCPLCLRKLVETEMGAEAEIKWGGAITSDALNKFDFVARSAYRKVEDDVVSDLAKLGAPAVAPLGEMLRSKDGRIASAIAEALGKIGDRAAVPSLTFVMGDEGKQFGPRLSCAVSLAHLDEPSSVPVLISGLRIASELLVIERMVREEFDKFELRDAINLRIMRNEASSLRRLCLDALEKATKQEREVEATRRLVHLLRAASLWERWWGEASGRRGSNGGAPFTFKALYCDPWGNQVWMERTLSAQSERRDLRDHVLLIGMRRYIRDLGRGLPLKTLMAQLAGFDCGASAYPAELSDANRYSFKGFVRISDKILEYKCERDTSRWVYSGMMWVGVPGEGAATPIPQ